MLEDAAGYAACPTAALTQLIADCCSLVTAFLLLACSSPVAGVFDDHAINLDSSEAREQGLQKNRGLGLCCSGASLAADSAHEPPPPPLHAHARWTVNPPY